MDLGIQAVPLETHARLVAEVVVITPLAMDVLAGVLLMAVAHTELVVKIESLQVLTLQVPTVPAAAVAAGATQKHDPSVPRIHPN